MTDSASPLPHQLPPGASDDGSAIRVGPEGADRRLVLLHGWGADADDLLDLAEALVGPEVSVVALRAPLPHPAGMGRQWYDLQLPEWPQLPAARRDLRSRLEALARSVPLERTAVLGFSQGAAMALDVATGEGATEAGTREAGGGTVMGAVNQAEAMPLAALIACSGYPHPDWKPRRPRTRILLTHGEQDEVVPFAASTALEQRLREVGGTVERLAFAGGHGIEPALLPRLRSFLAAGWALPPSGV